MAVAAPKIRIPKINYFTTRSPKAYLEEYVSALSSAISKIPEKTLNELIGILRETAQNKGHVFAAGNGGSASIANHLCCDWTKGTEKENEPPLMSQSLMANSSLVSALANDIGYEYVIAKQLEMFASKGDVLILISSSGESPYILQAAKKAHELGIKVVGLSGFDGGKLNEIADVNVHIPFSNYALVQDGHQIIMHVIAQYFFLMRTVPPKAPLSIVKR